MAFYQREQLHPSAGRMRHAQHLAATHNGPLSRNDKRLWRAADLMPADPWAPPEPDPAPPTFEQLKAQAMAINSARRGLDP